jgi:hypothetical protein
VDGIPLWATWMAELGSLGLGVEMSHNEMDIYVMELRHYLMGICRNKIGRFTSCLPVSELVTTVIKSDGSDWGWVRNVFGPVSYVRKKLPSEADKSHKLLTL